MSILTYLVTYVTLPSNVALQLTAASEESCLLAALVWLWLGCS